MIFRMFVARAIFKCQNSAFPRILPQIVPLWILGCQKSNEMVKSIDDLKLMSENNEWADSPHLPGTGKSTAVVINVPTE